MESCWSIKGMQSLNFNKFKPWLLSRSTNPWSLMLNLLKLKSSMWSKRRKNLKYHQHHQSLIPMPKLLKKNNKIKLNRNKINWKRKDQLLLRMFMSMHLKSMFQLILSLHKNKFKWKSTKSKKFLKSLSSTKKNRLPLRNKSQLSLFSQLRIRNKNKLLVNNTNLKLSNVLSLERHPRKNRNKNLLNRNSNRNKLK